MDVFVDTYVLDPVTAASAILYRLSKNIHVDVVL